MHDVVTGSTEVRIVIIHKFRVRGHSTGVLLHGSVQFENIVLQDGIWEHGGWMQDKVVRWWLRWFGGGD